MSVGVYFDHNVEYRIAAGLRRRGISVTIAREDGRGRTADPELLARSTELHCVLFTHDRDFIAITTEWMMAERPFLAVVYVAQQELSIRDTLDNLEYIVKAYTLDELRNTFFHLPLR